MITFLEGVVVEKQSTRLVLCVGGVGYELFVPLSSHDRIPGPGGTCRILTYDHVREDQHALYGFATEVERRLFNLLMTVTGIGPKLALSTLSGLSVGELLAAISAGDSKRLSSIPGVGKKTAERIIVELRDKLDAADMVEARAGVPDELEADEKVRDAILALVSLGYRQSDAREMVRKTLALDRAPENVAEIVRRSLAQ